MPAFEQKILNDVWDESNHSLRTTGSGSGGASDSTQIENSAGTVIDPATSQKQDTINTSIQSLLTELQAKADLAETQPVSVASLPNEGQQTMANSISVAIASDQSDLPVVNTDTLGENGIYASADPLFLSGFVAKSTPTQLITGDGRYVIPQTTLKGEVYVKHTDAVTLSSLPAGNNNIGDVDIASSALPAGAATSAAQATLETDVEGINTRLGEVQASPTANTVLDRLKALLTELQLKADLTETQPVSVASLPLPSGAATETTLGTRLSESDFDTKVGALTEAAPATDTASSGLNGRLQRIAQRLTSLIALVPSALTGSGNFKVAVQEALPAGTNAIGKLAANSGVDIGDVDVTSLPGLPASASVTGLSVSKTDALVATATAVKASAGRVYGYHIYNPNSVDIYVQFYDIASGSVTVGTSARTVSLWIPAGGALDSLFTIPITFGTAITIAATTTITGNTAPSTGLLVDIFYI